MCRAMHSSWHYGEAVSILSVAFTSFADVSSSTLIRILSGTVSIYLKQHAGLHPLNTQNKLGQKIYSCITINYPVFFFLSPFSFTPSLFVCFVLSFIHSSFLFSFPSSYFSFLVNLYLFFSFPS